MEKMRRHNMKRKTLVFIMATVFLMMFILTSLTPYLVDDYGYMYSFADGEKISSLWDIVRSMIQHSRTTNGRIIAHGLEQFFLLLPKPVFNICNALVFIWVCFFVYRIANFGRETNAILFLIFPMCYWLFTPAFGQSTLWQVGSLNYLWSVAFCLFFVRPYLCWYLDRENSSWLEGNWLGRMLFIMLAFLFGLYSEIAAMVGILVALGFLIVRGLESRRWRTWLWIPLGIAIIGYILLLHMPAEQINKAGSLKLHDIIARFPILTKRLTIFTPLCIAWVVMMFFSLETEGSHKRRVVSLAFFLGGIVGIYVMLAAVFIPERCLCCSSTFFSIACIVLLPELLETRVGDGCRAALCTLAVLFSIQFIFGVFDIQAVHSRAVTRDRSAAEQIAAGNSEIVLDIIYGTTEYSAVKYLKDLDLENPNTWPNDAMAKYYGATLVIGNDPENELNNWND